MELEYGTRIKRGIGDKTKDNYSNNKTHIRALSCWGFLNRRLRDQCISNK